MLKEAKVSEFKCGLWGTVKMVWKGMQLAERGVKTVGVGWLQCGEEVWSISGKHRTRC